MDPIRPISSPAESIPPVGASTRIDPVSRRQRDPREHERPSEEEPEDSGEDESSPDDEPRHIDISA